jgi:hypothetical protein
LQLEIIHCTLDRSNGLCIPVFQSIDREINFI